MQLTDRDRSLLFEVVEDCATATYSLEETLLESFERRLGLPHAGIFFGTDPASALATMPAAMRGRTRAMCEPYVDRYHRDDVFRTPAGMGQLTRDGIVSLHDVDPALRDLHPEYVRDFHGGFGTRSVVLANIQLARDACAVAVIVDFDGDVPLTTMRRLNALRPLLAAQFRGFRPASQPGGPRLTPRERQIVALISKGYRNQEIARACGVKPDSIKRYLTTIFAEFGVRNRTQLALRVADTPEVTAAAGG